MGSYEMRMVLIYHMLDVDIMIGLPPSKLITIAKNDSNGPIRSDADQKFW